LYKELDPAIKDNTRADIIIGTLKKVGKKTERINKYIHSVIELKRYENSKQLIQNDFEKLWELRKKLPQLRLFEILVGQGKLPDKLFSESYNINRNSIYEGKLKFKAIPRMGKKSFNTKKELNSGNYAVLIELVNK